MTHFQHYKGTQKMLLIIFNGNNNYLIINYILGTTFLKKKNETRKFFFFMSKDVRHLRVFAYQIEQQFFDKSIDCFILSAREVGDLKCLIRILITYLHIHMWDLRCVQELGVSQHNLKEYQLMWWKGGSQILALKNIWCYFVADKNVKYLLKRKLVEEDIGNIVHLQTGNKLLLPLNYPLVTIIWNWEDLFKN